MPAGDARTRMRERDELLSTRLRLEHRPHDAVHRVASVVAHSGDGWLCLAVIVAIGLAGGAEGRTLAAPMLLGFVATWAVVRLVKTSIRRTRPAGEWNPSQRRRDPHAFPSGHAARATMLAVVVSAILGSPWVAVALGVWALAVAAARVAVGVHYVLDVVAGMLIGAAIGVLATVALGF